MLYTLETKTTIEAQQATKIRALVIAAPRDDILLFIYVLVVIWKDCDDGDGGTTSWYGSTILSSWTFCSGGKDSACEWFEIMTHMKCTISACSMIGTRNGQRVSASFELERMPCRQFLHWQDVANNKNQTRVDFPNEQAIESV